MEVNNKLEYFLQLKRIILLGDSSKVYSYIFQMYYLYDYDWMKLTDEEETLLLEMYCVAGDKSDPLIPPHEMVMRVDMILEKL